MPKGPFVWVPSHSALKHGVPSRMVRGPISSERSFSSHRPLCTAAAGEPRSAAPSAATAMCWASMPRWTTSPRDRGGWGAAGHGQERAAVARLRGCHKGQTRDHSVRDVHSVLFNAGVFGGRRPYQQGG